MTQRSGLILAVLAGVVSLGAAETGLWLLAPISDPFERYKAIEERSDYIPSAHPGGYSMRITAEEGLPGVQGTKHYTTNNVGFRGDRLVRPKPSHESRLFMVGGSTTENLVLDDSEIPTAVLQDTLNRRLGSSPSVRAYNAGKAGDRSYDHVAMIAHRIMHLQPDLIVLFAGVNDLIAANHHVDYLHFTRTSIAPLSLSNLLKFTATEFQLPRRIYAVRRGFAPETERETLERISLVTDYRHKVSLVSGKPVFEDVPRTDLVHYANNLRTIAGIATAHRVPLVLMTQATTWNSSVDPAARDWHWLTYMNGIRFREDLLDAAMEQYNETMRQIAEEQDVLLLDLAAALPKSLRYFFDDVHFNVEGARIAGEMLADVVLASGIVAAPALAADNWQR